MLTVTSRDDSYLGGRWRASAGTDRVRVVDPATEEVIGEVPAGHGRDVDVAVDSARRAFDGWAATPIEQRTAMLAPLGAAIDGADDELTALIVHEAGVPARVARNVHVGRLASNVANILELAAACPPPERIGTSLVVHEPAGVVGSISPWNFPFGFMTKVLPALVAGCTVVAKPSEVTPFSAYRMTEMIHELGLPPGVLNVVVGTGPAAGNALAAHPGLDMITLTGSRATGSAVLRAIAGNITRPVLELGGKSAAVVLDGAPFEQAVRATVGSCYFNNGQVCGAQTRLIVPAARMGEAAAIAADQASQWVCGPLEDPVTTLGPVVNASQHRRVLGLISSGLDQGATLVCGGVDRPAEVDRGYFVAPTVFADVLPDMTIAQEEIFGPVLSILGASSTDDAVRIANHSDYGLSGAVWAADDEEAVGVARRLRTGQVQINEGMFNLFAPFGGFRRSGIGRENGVYGFREFFETKSLQLAAGRPGVAGLA